MVLFATAYSQHGSILPQRSYRLVKWQTEEDICRLVYPMSQHAPPQLWEYQQPYIGNLILNACTFDRRVVQWYFKDWEALDRDNTRIWGRIIAPSLYLPTWPPGKTGYPSIASWLSTCRRFMRSIGATVW